MQNAETVLGVLRERGRRGLPLERLYRQLFNPQLYLLAYGRLYSNRGAMTPGADGETADGMTLRKIGRIMDALRHERYRFAPARRVHIPKKNGKTRPLGLPSWSDKLVGEVMRLLLEAYYEPQFSDRSHGFRPRRGCHTALNEVGTRWTGTTWFIEGDIAQCFDRLDHGLMLQTLGEKIHDNRFLRLVHTMLKAGYLEDWRWNATLSGTPQGGVVSPILSNIYLDRLDKWVETVLIPEVERGEGRARCPAYRRMSTRIRTARRRGDRATARALRRQQRRMPSGDPDDPGFRRLRYSRYADDHLLGFIGPKSEAEQIKARLAQFLREELKLELSEGKTLVTHARTKAARYLGYEITVQHADHKVTGRARSANGIMALRVPRSVIKAKRARYYMRGKPAPRRSMVNKSDHIIVSTFGAEYRGLANYYLLAQDVWRLDQVRWVMETSMLKTLACKRDSTVSKMAARYRTTVETPHGPRRAFQASVERPGRSPLVATFGGIPLVRQRYAVIPDRMPIPAAPPRKELIRRFLAGRCEMCGCIGNMEVHQVGKLVRLLDKLGGGPRPDWVELMVKMRRKTLVVCPACHRKIHGRKSTVTLME